MQVKELKAAASLNVALASWALCSAYAWWHGGAQFVVTVLVGAVVAIVAPFEFREFGGAAKVRKLTTAAGLALAASALLLPRLSSATAWNNVIVGLLIAGVSLLGPPHAPWSPPHLGHTTS